MGEGPESADVLMARMTKDELAMGRKGIKMAQERMARERARGAGAVTDRETSNVEKLSRRYLGASATPAEREAIARRALGAQATQAEVKALRSKAVPAAGREPMYGPAKRLSIPLKNGGLATMPKKGC
jgi:Arc/MetJ family transcription regulator